MFQVFGKLVSVPLVQVDHEHLIDCVGIITLFTINVRFLNIVFGFVKQNLMTIWEIWSVFVPILR